MILSGIGGSCGFIFRGVCMFSEQKVTEPVSEGSLTAACDFSFLNKPGGMFYNVRGKSGEGQQLTSSI